MPSLHERSETFSLNLADCPIKGNLLVENDDLSGEVLIILSRKTTPCFDASHTTPVPLTHMTRNATRTYIRLVDLRDEVVLLTPVLRK